MVRKHLAAMTAVLTATTTLLFLLIFMESISQSFSNPALAASQMRQDAPLRVVERALRAVAATHTVCPAGPPTCNFSVLQDAVDAASPGDIIKVASATYSDLSARPRNDFTSTGIVTQVVYISKTITIQGGFTTTEWTAPDPVQNPTVLDALRQGRVFYITGDISPTITGFHISGGDATGLGGGFFGDDDTGAGVYAITATLTISDCSIYDNHAGGGVSVESAGGGLVQNNTFFSNYGGGLSIENGDVAVRENVFRGNSGGGLNIFSSDATVYGNLVTENSSNDGGGMSLGMFGGTLNRNVIISNTAEGNGGGISVMGSGTWHNNVIADNHAGGSGGALYIRPGGPELVHTTIARNSSGDGSAIYVTSGPIPFAADVKLINTIIVSHSVGIHVTSGHTVTVDTVLWHDTPVKVAPGSNVMAISEMDGDPAFAADGYHLTAHSAAIDWGLNAGVEEDIDGESRPAGAGYDLGADELWVYVYLPAVLKDPP